jgi:uncharacterized membrane protein YsdA (DUF1294 family)
MPRRPQRRRPITAATIVGLASFALPICGLFLLGIRSGTVLPLAYTCIMSTATFILYGYDKIQARNLEWRVKESTLHIMELIGGWPGALLGQHYFQHKTRKASFLVVFWIIVGAWQAVW